MVSKEQIKNSLKRFHFYSGIQIEVLPASEREAFKKFGKKIILLRRKILFKQGSFPTGIFVLKSGKLKVYQTNSDGSIQVLFIYTIGDVFGYRPILSNDYQPATVAALEDSELLFIERKNFINLIVKSISLSNQLLISLSREFTVLTNRITLFAQRGIKERFAIVLLILNEKYKSDKESISEITLSRTDLANFVGTSVESLSRMINVFKTKKLIKTEGKKIMIENIRELYLLSAID